MDDNAPPPPSPPNDGEEAARPINQEDGIDATINDDDSALEEIGTDMINARNDQFLDANAITEDDVFEVDDGLEDMLIDDDEEDDADYPRFMQSILRSRVPRLLIPEHIYSDVSTYHGIIDLRRGYLDKTLGEYLELSGLSNVKRFVDIIKPQIENCLTVPTYRIFMLSWMKEAIHRAYEVDEVEKVYELKPTLLPDKSTSLEKVLLDVLSCAHDLQYLVNLEPRKTEQCGRMFVSNDVIYQCLDCAIDPTCVFCTECFVNSAHRYHRYRVQQSDGGGFCDCGDDEAWTSFPNCSIHEPEDDSDLTNVFIQPSSTKLIAKLLHFCRDILFAKPVIDENVVQSEQDPHVHEEFVTVTYNDEVHSFGDITSLMVDCLNRTRAQGYDIAHTIDKVGRGVLFVDRKDHCIAIINRIKQRVNALNMSQIKLSITHLRLIKFQHFAVKVLDMIEKFLRRSKHFRLAFCEAMETDATSMREDYATGRPTLLATIMPDCDRLWKEVRAVWTRIFVVALLENRWKELVAEYYIANYDLMWTHYMSMTDDTNCCSDLSVQFLTTPSISLSALRDHDALSVIIRCISHRLRQHFHTVDPGNGRSRVLVFDADVSYRSLFGRKCLRMMSDVRHLLQSVINAICYSTLDESSKKAMLEVTDRSLLSGATSLVEFSCMFEGVNSFRRRVDVHVPREPEWESAFVFLMKLHSILRFFYQIISQRLPLLLNTTITVINALYNQLPDIQADKIVLEEVQISGDFYHCISTNVLEAQHSAHHPATRLLTGLLTHLVFWADTDEGKSAYHDAMSLVEERFTIRQFMESPVTIRALVGQVCAQMWIRNGTSVINSLHLLSSGQCCSEMSDRDLQALQMAAAWFGDPNEFVAQVVFRYGLKPWASFEDITQLNVQDSGYTYKQTNFVVEHMLDLLMNVVCERYNQNIGQISLGQWLRRQIVHYLCIKPNTHAAIIRRLDETASDLNESNPEIFEQVLEQISTQSSRQSAENSSIFYTIKPEVADAEFDPYYYRYAVSERNEAEHSRLEWRKLKNMPHFLPVPNPPPFRDVLQSIPDILECDLMVKIYMRILRLALSLRTYEGEEGPAKHHLSTDGQVRKTLDLIGIAAQRPPGQDTAFYRYSKELAKMLNDISKEPYLSNFKDHATYVRSLLPCYEETSQPLVLDNNRAIQDEQRKKMAKERKARMLEMMARKQMNFAKSHKVDLDNVQEADNLSSNAYACIICQDKQSAGLHNRPMGVMCYVQRSNVLMPCDAQSYPLPFVMTPVCRNGVHINSCGHMMHVDCYNSYFTSLRVTNEMAMSLMHLFYDKQQNEFPCPLCRALNNCLLPLLPSLKCAGKTETEKMDMDETAKYFDEFINQVAETESRHPTKPGMCVPNEEQGSMFNVEQDYETGRIYQIVELGMNMRSNDIRNLEMPVHRQIVVSSPKQKLNTKQLTGWLFGNSEDLHYVVEGARILGQYGDFLRQCYFGTPSCDCVDVWPLWCSTTYTLYCHQQYLQLCEKNIFSEQQIPSSTHLLLSQLFAPLFYHTMSRRAEEIKPAFVSALQFLQSPSIQPMMTDMVTELDVINALLCLICTWNVYLHEEGKLQDAHISDYFVGFVRLALARHCLNIVNTMSPYWHLNPSYSSDGTESSDNLAMQTFIHLVESREEHSMSLGMVAPPGSTPKMFSNAIELRRAISEMAMPLLRAICYLKRYLIQEPFNEIMADAYEIGEAEMELATILDYLGLGPHDMDLWVLLFKHSYIDKQPYFPYYLSTSLHHKQILMSLPEEYVMLLAPSTVSHGLGVPNCKQAYLCLVCGELICVSVRLQNLRAMVSSRHQYSTLSLEEPSDLFGDADGRAVAGEACRHVAKCSWRSGCGILLRIKECLIICLQLVSRRPLKVRGAKMSAPYANEFGEPDDLLRRGDKLMFSKTAYDKIKKIWLGHSVPQVTSKYGQSYSHAYGLHWENM